MSCPFNFLLLALLFAVIDRADLKAEGRDAELSTAYLPTTEQSVSQRYQKLSVDVSSKNLSSLYPTQPTHSVPTVDKAAYIPSPPPSTFPDGSHVINAEGTPLPVPPPPPAFLQKEEAPSPPPPSAVLAGIDEPAVIAPIGSAPSPPQSPRLPPPPPPSPPQSPRLPPPPPPSPPQSPRLPPPPPPSPPQSPRLPPPPPPSPPQSPRLPPPPPPSPRRAPPLPPSLNMNLRKLTSDGSDKSYKFPTLKWATLNPTQVKGTVFDNFNYDEIANTLNQSFLETMLKISGQNDHTTDQPSPRTRTSSTVIKKNTKLEPIRSLRIGIAKTTLMKNRTDINTIITAINNFDLSHDAIDILLQIMPTPTEVKLYKDCKSFEELSSEDKLIGPLSQIERLSDKLNIMKSMDEFDNTVELLASQIQLVTSASKSIKDAKSFHEVIGVIWTVVNANNIHRNGIVHGFKLSSLNSAQHKQALNEQIIEGVEAPDKLKYFVEKSEFEKTSLMESFEKAQEAFRECAEYYGEIPGAKYDSAEFFNAINTFVRHFEQDAAVKKAIEEDDQQWFVTGVERGGRGCFIEPVEKRDAITLNCFIQKYILPGTAIMTDGWAGYNGVVDLPEGYEHYVVNHSENFVNPEDPDIYTQSIESMHQKFKHRHKKEYGTARSKLVSYIEEYLWRRHFNGNDVFYHFWQQISVYKDYKCE